MDSLTPDRKPVLLVFPFPFLSHYLRCIVLAREFRSQYDILFPDHPDFGAFVQQEAFGSFECSLWDTTGLVQRLQNFDFSWLNTTALERHMPERLSVIQKYKPAAVIGDNDPVLKMAAALAAIPYTALMNGYLSKYYAGVRSLSPRHPVYAVLRLLPSSLRDRLTVIGERRSMRTVQESFNTVRAKHGLPPLDSYQDELEGDVNLICDPADLFPQLPLPANYRVIGPLLYEPPGERATVTSLLDPTRKTIFVNMGSSGDWEAVRFLNDPFYRRYNIITAGDTTGILADVRRANFSFIGASAILPLAHLVICHGGNGILHQCLQYHVPALCKTAWFEQEWNVQALERAGWGQSLDGITDEVKLQEAVEKWIKK